MARQLLPWAIVCGGSRTGRTPHFNHMSVLIEAISVVIQLEAVERFYPGGLEGLIESPPNGTLCHDDQLVRVGFMTPFYQHPSMDDP